MQARGNRPRCCSTHTRSRLRAPCGITKRMTSENKESTKRALELYEGMRSRLGWLKDFSQLKTHFFFFVLQGAPAGRIYTTASTP